MASNEPWVFISHINEESELAETLKNWLEGSFPDQLKVFVSSDSDSIPPGAEWRDELDQALGDAAAMVVISSPEALHRPWVSFETGCGWIKDIPVVPICHSGLDKGSLPRPYSRFEALNLRDEQFAETLLACLSDHLGLTDVPRIQFGRMQDELVAAAESREEPSEQPLADEEGVSNVEDDNLAEEQLMILALIADHGALAPLEIGEELNMHKQTARYWCEELQELGFTKFNRSLAGEPSTFSLTQDGRAFLVKHEVLT